MNIPDRSNKLAGRHCALALKELLQAIDTPEKVRGDCLANSRQVRYARTALKEARESGLPDFDGI